MNNIEVNNDLNSGLKLLFGSKGDRDSKVIYVIFLGVVVLLLFGVYFVYNFQVVEDEFLLLTRGDHEMRMFVRDNYANDCFCVEGNLNLHYHVSDTGENRASPVCLTDLNELLVPKCRLMIDQVELD